LAELIRASHEYDLVLMACKMRVLDGLKTTEIIRRELPTQQIPIIGMGTHFNDELASHAHAVGMSNLLSKPLQMKQLQKCLSRHMQPQFLDMDGTG